MQKEPRFELGIPLKKKRTSLNLELIQFWHNYQKNLLVETLFFCSLLFFFKITWKFKLKRKIFQFTNQETGSPAVRPIHYFSNYNSPVPLSSLTFFCSHGKQWCLRAGYTEATKSILHSLEQQMQEMCCKLVFLSLLNWCAYCLTNLTHTRSIFGPSLANMLCASSAFFCNICEW